MKIPEGFVVEDHGCALVMARKDMLGVVTRLLVPPPWKARERYKGAALLTGRAPIPSVPIPDGRRVVIRTYRHGGLLRGLTRDIFVGLLPRPFRELSVSIRARERGVPTPPVLGAAVYPIIGPIYRGAIAIEEISEARDGLSILRQACGLSPRQRKQLLRTLLPQIGKTVARAHAAGLVHTDLNIKNLVICPQPLSVFILDLDRCRIEKKALNDRQRRTQLLRLHRSLIKQQQQNDVQGISESDLVYFLRGYCEESGLDLRPLKQFLERWY